MREGGREGGRRKGELLLLLTRSAMGFPGGSFGREEGRGGGGGGTGLPAE